MKSVIAILLLSVSLTAAANARTVVVDGDAPAGIDALRRTAQLVVADSIVADSVRTLLERNGYLESRVSLRGDTLEIHAGRRSMLEAIESTDGTVLLENIGRPFTPEAVDAGTSQVLASYREQGHYYASATVRSVQDDAGRIRLVVEVTPGPVLRVESVSLIGLERTDDALVRRFITIDSGDTITARNIRKWADEASELGFIDFLEPVDISPRPGFTGADVAFRFVERQSVRVEGAAGYVPDDPTGLVWTIDAALLNLFGGGRQAEVRSERRERGRSLFEVGYRQPFFLVGTGTAGLSVATRDYRDSFYEFGVDGYAESQLFESFSVGVNGGWKTVEPSDNRTGYRRFLAGFSLVSHSLDNRLNPRSGVDLRWQISYANRRYRDDTLSTPMPRRSLNDTRTDARIDWYIPVAGSLIGRLGVRYRGVETSEDLPPLSEMILVGGPGTIRGYRNEQFAVLRTAIGAIEPRLRFDAGYLFVFYDAAYTSERRATAGGGVATIEQYLQAYGLGFSLNGQSRTGSRSLTLSLGWADGADFDQPRLSVELTAGL